MTFSLEKMINATIYIGTRKEKKKKKNNMEEKVLNCYFRAEAFVGTN